MQGDFKMLLTILIVAALSAVAQSSGGHHLGAPIANAPVVTAASSQYFERTFNRLVAAQPVIPVAPAPPVFVQTAQALPIPVPPPRVIPFQPIQPPLQPAQPVQPAQQPQPVEPNVSIAVATANAAAPVATILLPPYPFGFPPGFGFIPQEQPSNVDEQTREPEQTTTKTTTQVEVKTTTREPESTTPLPAGSDNNFVQALPSNQDVNGFKQYLAPAPPRPQLQPQPSQQALPFAQPQPLPHHHHHHHHPHAHFHLHPVHSDRPQKLKTSVEVVKVPLAYIAPPPLPHFPHNHEAIKVVKHIHSFVPSRAKLIIRPVSSIHTRSVPVKVIAYKPAPVRNVAIPLPRNGRPGNNRDIEYTTIRPFTRPSNVRPPRL